MPLLIGLVIILFLAGIILLGSKSPFEKKNREQFLQELTDFLEGTLELIEDDAEGKSFRIKFQYKDEDFVYEDYERQGFKDKVYQACLKVKTPSPLTLAFTEKERSTRVKTDIFIASNISTLDLGEYIPLQVPKHLKDLKALTNDPANANKILEDKKIVSIFRKFKNVDNRGYPFLSIGIVKGEVILEFGSIKAFRPNVFELRADIPSIDDYLEKMTVICRKLKEIR